MGWLTRWRRERILRRTPFDHALWQATVARLPVLEGLSADDLERLRQLVVLFLHGKSVQGAAGLDIVPEMPIAIAAQACLLVLNLDIDFYRGWVEVIVYPDEFIPEHEVRDEAGVVHTVRHRMMGESWLNGPVILSWQDAQPAVHAHGDGINVVLHEFAHKIDMRNGDANGYPPLHAGMSRSEWSAVFSAAYEDMQRRAYRGLETCIDPYGGESPAEFFAVATEAFFEVPARLVRCYPDVYRQLSAFYRQDPVQRRMDPDAPPA